MSEQDSKIESEQEVNSTLETSVETAQEVNEESPVAVADKETEEEVNEESPVAVADKETEEEVKSAEAEVVAPTSEEKPSEIAAIEEPPEDLTEQMEAPLEIIEPENPLPGVEFESLDDITKSALVGAGWSKLLPVQTKTIPYMNAGRDMLIQSKTGSGKTGAFLIPLLQIVEVEHNFPQALILAPTRELALQIKTECDRIQGNRGVKSVAVFGGVKYEPQIKAFNEGVHIVIATPGRLMDHLEQRNLDFLSLRDLVLDEADEMLSMGFYEDLKKIRKYLPKQFCTTMFSATFNESIKTLSREFQANNAGFLSLSFDKISVDSLAHSYMVCDPMDKDKTIVSLLEFEVPESAIIFCNMKRDVEYLADYLRKFGFDPGVLSGDVSQSQRQKTLLRFRKQSLKILIATDVAARGIDISHVTHVILHDHPEDSEVYIHRAGRTARAGRSGKAISVVSPVEELALKKTARQFEIRFEKLKPLDPTEVQTKVENHILNMLEKDHKGLKIALQNQVPRFEKFAKKLVEEDQEKLLALLINQYYMNSHKDQEEEVVVVASSDDYASDQKPFKKRNHNKRR